MKKTPASLKKIFTDHWDAFLRWDPTSATFFGDHRFDDQLPSATEKHFTDWLKQLTKF